MDGTAIPMGKGRSVQIIYVDYEKRLQYPINITQPNAKIAQYIMSQYGGPDSNTL